MAQTELNVSQREGLGKGTARSLRREGLIPAVMYGKGVENCSLVVEPKQLAAIIGSEAGLNSLITLKGEGAFDGKVVILKDMQVDPIRQTPLHVDFQAIDLNAKTHVLVPLVVVGKSEGEKQGGNLQIIRHEVELVCLPANIPANIEVDVTALNIGDALHVQDVQLPEGVEIPQDVNFTVVTVTGRTAEVEEEGAEVVEEGEEAAEAGE
ncbi:ribosomal protein L25 [Syntrophotalea carbinolica DSM 2380]|uniref:Large ribosomal subunit protein bL25 n=1 Tax=Syntrophotalea carbinolica (strain DSM 2380 / NBRC 103641 / GraBd1) TaxID=338963 RepID=RL25_SYNC1|nr:50S ribosomal protein L25/general stress protein Ctc [Syntrophotalea carbinolica]Q3A313.1 RecName: Full=Large ribosomal subunit protein bL25; AltName: Full=50S ribosomal protein L25; AltName: Full=General stress protein CTC [Syntrophotalea carbinolica DSM 2380]ABA89244.1 ribosomal protein L25 [Syntrophotalea carbinolica DSM 2380]